MRSSFRLSLAGALLLSSTALAAQNDTAPAPADDPMFRLISAETAAAAARVTTSDDRSGDILYAIPQEDDLLKALVVSFHGRTVTIPGATISVIGPNLVHTSLSAAEVEKLSF